jgi:hypothetical protein
MQVLNKGQFGNGKSHTILELFNKTSGTDLNISTK